MATNTEGKAYAAALLREMQESLRSQGITRFPQRSDFSDEQVVLIKAYLGPWPRALEAAGLKTPKQNAADRQQKRIAAKRRRTAAKIADQSSNTYQTNDKGEEP